MKKHIIVTGIMAAMLMSPCYAQTIDVCGLTFEFADTWNKTDESDINGVSCIEYEGSDGSIAYFASYDYDGDTATSSIIDGYKTSLSKQEGYMDLGSQVDEKDGMTRHFSVFYLGDHPCTLYAFDAGGSIVDILCISNSDTTTDEAKQFEKDTEWPTTLDSSASVETKETKDDAADKYRYSIQSYVTSTYNQTDVDRIEINENYGTDAYGDYVALVYLTWNVKNSAGTTTDMLRMYSDDLAATIGTDLLNIEEVAIFWTVPYLNASGKWAYSRKGEGMYKTDEVIGWK